MVSVRGPRSSVDWQVDAKKNRNLLERSLRITTLAERITSCSLIVRSAGPLVRVLRVEDLACRLEATLKEVLSGVDRDVSSQRGITFRSGHVEN